jgi:restriction system-associated AAA family ATPase
MKLLRLKITDPAGFRSLQPGFEHYFRTEWSLQAELSSADSFAPFVCAGRNGSGKSNLLEALAAIFFQLEVLRVRRSFLPASFVFDPVDNLQGIKDGDGTPNAFELEYLIPLPKEYQNQDGERRAHVYVNKERGSSPQIKWVNAEAFDAKDTVTELERDFLLPQYVLGYSSGENEILSLPFFKMRFIQFDEYWHALTKQLPYPGRPETRLAYMDNSFSQAILLCNMLFQDAETLRPFREDVGIEELKEFRIIIKRSIEVPRNVAEGFMDDNYAGSGGFQDDNFASNSALVFDSESGHYTVNLMQQLEADAYSANQFDPVVTRLKRCATCWCVDEDTNTLVLDYWVNDATKQAFRENFDFDVNKSPIALFQAFQVLLALNLYAVSDALKADLYKSNSHYVSETVPTLASDQRIMRFKFVKFSKRGVTQPMMLKELSDGEHQLLHSLGLCLLFKNTNSLFLLDEPETHFNPDWRSNFISRLRQCLATEQDTDTGQEMLITTHTPFLISDSKPEKVLVFSKSDGVVSVTSPEYNTLGASINKITMKTFGKRETIGGHAQSILEGLRARFERGDEDKEVLIDEIHQQLGDSVEKVLLIKAILDSEEAQG